ncbi:MAG: hypothetical protein WC663_01475 [Patescibacteria group bacterium]|jgi:hypothetical protein
MPEQPSQVELKDIQQTKETESETGLEIVKTPESEQFVEHANEIHEAMQADGKITAGQVADLRKDLEGLKYDFYGEQLSIAEIRQIPDLQHNLKIWQEISNGKFRNYKELTYLTPEIAQKIVYPASIKRVGHAPIPLIDFPPRDLYLNNLKTLSVESARILLRRLSTGDRILSLQGLVDFPEEELGLLDDPNIHLSRELTLKLIEKKEEMGLI